MQAPPDEGRCGKSCQERVERLIMFMSAQSETHESSDARGSAGRDEMCRELALADLRQNNKSSRDDRPSAAEESTVTATPAGRTEAAHLRILSNTIEADIIPRLLQLHRNGDAHRICGASEGRSELGEPRISRPLVDEIDDFARLVIAREVPEVSSFVATLRNRGLSLESICLELLGPAAARLGEWWEEDFVDFTQVTVGLWRLQQVLHALSPASETEGEGIELQGRVLLAPVPGDNHTFGLIMVADFFRRAGWYVCDNAGPSTAELVAVVHDEFFDVIGLSVGCVDRFEAVVKAITALRRGSRNRQVRVMVGGAPFVGHPERAAEVGADATAMDAVQAPTEARALLDRLGTKKSASGKASAK